MQEEFFISLNTNVNIFLMKNTFMDEKYRGLIGIGFEYNMHHTFLESFSED